MAAHPGGCGSEASVSNICDRCGGVKTVYYEVEFIPGKRAALTQHQSSTIKLCMCPSERIQHDGKLGAHYEVLMSGRTLSIVGDARVNTLRDIVELDPQTALSLLTWLRQEETALEELAKEQP